VFKLSQAGSLGSRRFRRSVAATRSCTGNRAGVFLRGPEQSRWESRLPAVSGVAVASWLAPPGQIMRIVRFGLLTLCTVHAYTNPHNHDDRTGQAAAGVPLQPDAPSIGTWSILRAMRGFTDRFSRRIFRQNLNPLRKKVGPDCWSSRGPIRNAPRAEATKPMHGPSTDVFSRRVTRRSLFPLDSRRAERLRGFTPTPRPAGRAYGLIA